MLPLGPSPAWATGVERFGGGITFRRLDGLAVLEQHVGLVVEDGVLVLLTSDPQVSAALDEGTLDDARDLVASLGRLLDAYEVERIAAQS